jgi:hypothetical protein
MSFSKKPPEKGTSIMQRGVSVSFYPSPIQSRISKVPESTKIAWHLAARPCIRHQVVLIGFLCTNRIQASHNPEEDC